MAFFRFFVLLLVFLPYGRALAQPVTDSLRTQQPDSLRPQKPATLPIYLQDSVLNRPQVQRADTAAPNGKQALADSLKAASDLKDKVEYSAVDSIVFDVDSGMLYFYREVKIDYQDISLTSLNVVMEMDKQTLHASGKRIDEETWDGKPSFTQGDQTFEAEGMSYNFKSQKGRMVAGRSVQGDGFLLAGVGKRLPDGSINAENGRYTTCDLEHPHFYIESKRLKRVGEQMISGPLRLVIADFPIPIIVPFGFVPSTAQGQRDGVLLPRYGDSRDRGFFLENLGYYWGVSEYFDLAFTGSYYTLGGWSAGVRSTYNKKYHFSGNLGFTYGVTKFRAPTDPDFERTTAWSLNWGHNQPINPNTRISGSVNIVSSKAFTQRLSYNTADFFRNNLNSSVNFQKTFANTPFTMNVGASHTQDINRGTMTLNLPNVTLGMNRITPFSKIANRKLTWLKTLGLSYNMEARNSVEQFPDSLFLPILFNWRDTLTLPQIIGTDTSFVTRTAGSFYRNGLQHNLNLGTSLKLFKFINVAPSMTYREIWVTRTIRKTLNEETNRLENVTVPGFERGFVYAGSVGASTNFFGIYQLTRSKKEITFRQRFTPSVSYSLAPDFSQPQYGFYREAVADTFGRIQKYSIFEGAVYSGPGGGGSQTINFSLGSVLEMKYRSKESFDPDFDEKKDKFVRTNILDNMSLNTSYNLAADSFQLQPFRFAARTSLFKKLVNVNFGASMDPYVFDYDPFTFPEAANTPRRQNRFMIQETGQLGRITDAQLSFSANFRSQKRTGQKTKSADFDENEFQQIQRTLYQYVDFDIPWSANVSFNMNYNKPGLDAPRITQLLNVSGDFSFTPKWKIGITTGYDFVRKQANNTNVNIYRDLHCWEMSFGWTPFGPLQGYVLTINARSATLRDLRLTRNNRWQDRFQSF